MYCTTFSTVVSQIKNSINFFYFSQKHTEVPGIVHYIARTVVGVCGITYCSLQTVITYYLIKPQTNTVKLFALRLATSILLCVSGLMHVSMDVWLAAQLLKGTANAKNRCILTWRTKKTSCSLFIISVTGWLMYFLLCFHQRIMWNFAIWIVWKWAVFKNILQKRSRLNGFTTIIRNWNTKWVKTLI